MYVYVKTINEVSTERFFRKFDDAKAMVMDNSEFCFFDGKWYFEYGQMISAEITNDSVHLLGLPEDCDYTSEITVCHDEFEPIGQEFFELLLSNGYAATVIYGDRPSEDSFGYFNTKEEAENAVTGYHKSWEEDCGPCGFTGAYLFIRRHTIK